MPKERGARPSRDPVPIEVFRKPNARQLVVVFTAFNHRIGLPAPEFLEAAGLSHASAIVVSDRFRKLTFTGISDELNTFDKTLAAVTDTVASIGHDELIMTGHSGGGHSALLYGHLLKADTVVSFSPFTYLDGQEIASRQDPASRRHARSLAFVDLAPPALRPYLDLRALLSSHNGRTRYYVNIGRFQKWDRQRAEWLAGVPGLTVHKYPVAAHALVSVLARHEMLAPCFENPGVVPFSPRLYARTYGKMLRRRIALILS